MSRNYRVQVHIPAADGVVKDAIVNVWHFKHDPDPVSEPTTTRADSANDMVDQLQNFYQAIQSIYPLTVTGPFTCKVYDLADPEPRLPVLTRDIAITTGGEPLPDQVAIKLKVKAALTSGDNPRTHRGGVFLGPCYQGIATSTSSTAIISSATRTTIKNAFIAAFRTGLITTDPYVSVFSRKDATAGGWAHHTGGDATAGMHPIVSVTIDDRWDIQRRRAEGPISSTGGVLSAR